MSIKYIVTGTGRCGAKFMSKFLTSAGIKCGHEVIFFNGGIEEARKNILLHEDLEADSSYMAAPYLNCDILSNAKIIHVVREPMKVINSFVACFLYFLSSTPSCKKSKFEWTYAYPPGADPEFKFMNFMWSHLPALNAKYIKAVDRAAIYYIEWNRMIEQACSGRDFLFHPIESDVSKILDFMSVDMPKSNLHNDKTTNRVPHDTKYYLSDISEPIKSNLISMGKSYGYFSRPYMLL